MFTEKDAFTPGPQSVSITFPLNYGTCQWVQICYGRMFILKQENVPKVLSFFDNKL